MRASLNASGQNSKKILATANANGTDPGQTARDAIGVARDAFKVVSVVTNVTKTATCNPAPADCSQAKTGTVINYQLIINVTGSGSADALVITDPLPAELINPIALSVTPALVSPQTASITGTGPYTVTVDLKNVAVSPANPKTYTITFNAAIN